jgi:hypothetical protein
LVQWLKQYEHLSGEMFLALARRAVVWEGKQARGSQGRK